MSRYYGKKPVTEPVVLVPVQFAPEEIFVPEDPPLEPEEIFPDEKLKNDS